MPNEKVYFRNPYSFRVGGPLYSDVTLGMAGTGAGSGSDSLHFQNLTAPSYYDENSNMIGNVYVVPKGGLSMRFLVENITMKTVSSGSNFDLGIYAEDKDGSNKTLLAGDYSSSGTQALTTTPYTFVRIYSDYVTLNEGQRVYVNLVRVNAASTIPVQVAGGGIFFNSFE